MYRYEGNTPHKILICREVLAMDNFESLYVYNAMTGKLSVNGKPYRSYFVPE